MGIYIENMTLEEFSEYGEDCQTLIGTAQAVEIPPHGRLIDADALADIFHSSIAMYDSCPFNVTDIARRNELQSALTEVINAPTVIQAEDDV